MTTGFPEEIKARNQMGEQYSELEKLVGVKDAIIWALVEVETRAITEGTRLTPNSNPDWRREMSSGRTRRMRR